MSLNFGPMTRLCTKPSCTIENDNHICVDQSELGVERECQVREYLTYGLQLQSLSIPSPKNPFIHGSICHSAMETLYHANTWRDLKAARQTGFNEFSKYQTKDPFSDEGDNKLEWAALFSEVKDCIDRYYEYTEEIDKDYEPLAPETPFQICLKESEPQVYFYGKFDNPVIRKSDGKIVIMEFKFHAQMSEDPLYLDWDPQTTDYSFVGGEIFGDKWAGIDYRITRKVASKTLVNFVRKTPEELVRNHAQMQTQKRFVVVQALQILRNRRLGPIALVPAQSSNPISVANCCYRCDVREICDAIQNNEDWQYVAQTRFSPKEQYADHIDEPTQQETKELRVF